MYGLMSCGMTTMSASMSNKGTNGRACQMFIIEGVIGVKNTMT